MIALLAYLKPSKATAWHTRYSSQLLSRVGTNKHPGDTKIEKTSLPSSLWIGIVETTSEPSGQRIVKHFVDPLFNYSILPHVEVRLLVIKQVRHL